MFFADRQTNGHWRSHDLLGIGNNADNSNRQKRRQIRLGPFSRTLLWSWYQVYRKTTITICLINVIRLMQLITNSKVNNYGKIGHFSSEGPLYLLTWNKIFEHFVSVITENNQNSRTSPPPSLKTCFRVCPSVSSLFCECRKRVNTISQQELIRRWDTQTWRDIYHLFCLLTYADR